MRRYPVWASLGRRSNRVGQSDLGNELAHWNRVGAQSGRRPVDRSGGAQSCQAPGAANYRAGRRGSKRLMRSIDGSRRHPRCVLPH